MLLKPIGEMSDSELEALIDHLERNGPATDGPRARRLQEAQEAREQLRACQQVGEALSPEGLHCRV